MDSSERANDNNDGIPCESEESILSSEPIEMNENRLNYYNYDNCMKCIEDFHDSPEEHWLTTELIHFQEDDFLEDISIVNESSYSLSTYFSNLKMFNENCLVEREISIGDQKQDRKDEDVEQPHHPQDKKGEKPMVNKKKGASNYTKTTNDEDSVIRQEICCDIDDGEMSYSPHSIAKQFNMIAKQCKNSVGPSSIKPTSLFSTSIMSNENLAPEISHLRMHSDEITNLRTLSTNSQNEHHITDSLHQRGHSVLRSRSAAGALVDANIPRNKKLASSSFGNTSSGISPSEECADSSASLGSIEIPNVNDSNPINPLSSPSESPVSSGNKDISDNVKSMLAKRYHIIRELILVEKEYLKCLSTMVNGYMIPLKHDRILDEHSVDVIFYKIHDLMMYHVSFLNRLQTWEKTNTVGDKILEMFSRDIVSDCYCSFIENFYISEKTLETCLNTKTPFQKFCDNKAKEYRNKLPLKALLVQPAQRIPRYELIIKRLIEYTPKDHPDYPIILEAELAVHNLALKINTVKEIKQDEAIIEGEHLLNKLLSPVSLTPMRQYIQHDIVSVAERKDCVCIFMFTDQLVFTAMKRKSSQSIRKPQILRLKSLTGYDIVENIKYKVYQRIGLENIEFEKITQSELDLLAQNKELRDKKDILLLTEIEHISSKLEHKHQSLDLIIRKMYQSIQKDLEDLRNVRVTSPSHQLDCTSKFSVTTKDGTDHFDITFASCEKRQNWESRIKAQKMQLCAIPRTPKWSETVPIQKTLSGLKLSCAAPTETGIQLTSLVPRDVWICTSDGFTGQLCLLKLHPKTLVSANVPLTGCNSTINSIHSVPGYFSKVETKSKTSEDTAQHSPSGTARNSPEKIFLKRIQEAKNEAQHNSSEEVDDDDDENASSNSSDYSEVEEEQLEEDDSCETDNDNPVVRVTHVYERSATADSIRSHRQKILEKPKRLLDPYRATMWLGTEEGVVLIYYASDNVRLTRNRQKLNLPTSILDINHIDNKVFISCSDGDIYVYSRDSKNFWDLENPIKFRIDIEKDEITGISVQQLNPNHSSIGHAVVKKMVSVAGLIWCASKRDVFVINPNTRLVERSFQLPSGQGEFQSIANIVYGHHSVWISTLNTTKVYLYHANSGNFIFEIDLKATIMQKLISFDEIIQKHKEACLRITCLTICKDLLWVGTSAGVVLFIVIPKINSNSDKNNTPLPQVTTLDRGHTGNVRFLITLENALDHASGVPAQIKSIPRIQPSLVQSSSKSADGDDRDSRPTPVNVSNRRVSINPCTTMATLMHVISGGDGYEDFSLKSPEQFGSNDHLGESDSINHLIFWDVH